MRRAVVPSRWRGNLDSPASGIPRRAPVPNPNQTSQVADRRPIVVNIKLRTRFLANEGVQTTVIMQDFPGFKTVGAPQLSPLAEIRGAFACHSTSNSILADLISRARSERDAKWSGVPITLLPNGKLRRTQCPRPRSNNWLISRVILKAMILRPRAVKVSPGTGVGSPVADRLYRPAKIPVRCSSVHETPVGIISNSTVEISPASEICCFCQRSSLFIQLHKCEQAQTPAVPIPNSA